MSSDAFENIFRNGAKWVLVNLGRSEDVQRVLDAIKKKAYRDDADPRKDRELFVDPALLSQQLDVPFATVEQISRYLHRMNLLSLWIRALCPNAEEVDSGIILETADPKVAARVLREPCPHCGNFHELSWEMLETVFAINKDLAGSPKRFSLEKLRFVPIPDKHTISPEEIDEDRCKTLAIVPNGSFPKGKDDNPPPGPPPAASASVAPNHIETVLLFALRSNEGLQDIKPPENSLVQALSTPCVLLIVAAIAVVLVARCASQILAVLFLLATCLCVWWHFSSKVKIATGSHVLERGLIAAGLTAFTILGTAGVTGFNLKALVGEDQPWFVGTEYGQADYILVGLGLLSLVILCSIACLIMYLRLKHNAKA